MEEIYVQVHQSFSCRTRYDWKLLLYFVSDAATIPEGLSHKLHLFHPQI